MGKDCATIIPYLWGVIVLIKEKRKASATRGFATYHPHSTLLLAIKRANCFGHEEEDSETIQFCSKIKPETSNHSTPD